MANFFDKIANGAVGLEENMLGPDYKYYKHIRTPGAVLVIWMQWQKMLEVL